MRLFVAFDVPGPQKDSVEQAIRPLRAELPGARWTSREGWHVTLKFLGEVADDRLEEVRSIVSRCVARGGPVATALTDIGAFPNLRQPRVLWAGLGDERRRLEFLAARMEKKFGAAGFRQETRRLHPHLTLARFRSPYGPAPAVETNRPYSLDRTAFEVGEVILFRSRLSPKGASYEALDRFAL
ncbi:MAG: RNA 2',3'-cyclic phosphodiesterase [Actinomycetota bacterium]